jgi:nucleoside 2-deoxyribosyltransferase
MKIYLASPLFTAPQIATLEKVENALTELGYDFFSPRLDGGDLSQMTPAERSAAARRIFESNVRELNACDVYLINIDDRDVGTAWEFGYGYALQQSVANGATPHSHDKVLITYSSNGYGLNIMLNDSSEFHFPMTDGMIGAVQAFAAGDDTSMSDFYRRAELRKVMASFGQDLKANSDVH